MSQDNKISFSDIKNNIKQSMLNFDRKCLSCKSSNIRRGLVSLGLNSNKEICDFYNFNCNDCGDRFVIESAPLNHFKNVELPE